MDGKTCGWPVDAIIREADVDGDGEIDYKEFANMMLNKGEHAQRY